MWHKKKVPNPLVYKTLFLILFVVLVGMYGVIWFKTIQTIHDLQATVRGLQAVVDTMQPGNTTPVR